MKRKFTAGTLCRATLATLIVALFSVFTSCQKESTDLAGLVGTVPSSASMVLGLNLHSMLEKAGCKIEGSQIKPSKELQEWFESQKSIIANPTEKEAWKLIFSGESGIDPTGAVIFVDAYNTYATAALADTSKFSEFVEKQTGKKFNEENGVNVCGNVAIIGAQTWVCISSNADIDAKAIKNYSSLGASQSFASHYFGSNISTMTHDIVGFSLLKSLPTRSLGNMAMLQLAQGMIFDNATASTFEIDFLKGKLNMDGAILNDKGEPAKFLLPAKKIDASLVKGLADNAQAVGAVCIPTELVKKIEKLSSSLGGDMMGSIFQAMESLNGTVAGAVTNIDEIKDGISAVAQTDGNPSLDFMNILSKAGQTRKEGALVYLTSGTVTGNLEVEKAAKYLDGCTLGFMLDATKAPVDFTKEGIKAIGFTLCSDNGGLKYNILLESTDESANFLMTGLKTTK